MKISHVRALVSATVLAVCAAAWGGPPDALPAAAEPVSLETGSMQAVDPVPTPDPVATPSAGPPPVTSVPTAPPIGPPPPPARAPRLDWAAGDVILERTFSCTEEWTGRTFEQLIKLAVRAGRFDQVALQVSLEAAVALTAPNTAREVVADAQVELLVNGGRVPVGVGSYDWKDRTASLRVSGGGETMLSVLGDELVVSVEAVALRVSQRLGLGEPYIPGVNARCTPSGATLSSAVPVRPTGRVTLTVNHRFDPVSRSVTFEAAVPGATPGSTLSAYIGKPSIGLSLGGRRTIAVDENGTARWTVPGLWAAGKYLYEITPQEDPWFLSNRVTRRLEVPKNSVGATSSVATKKLSPKRLRVTAAGKVSSAIPVRPDGKVVVQIRRGSRPVLREVAVLDSEGRFRARVTIPRVAGKHTVKVTYTGSKNFAEVTAADKAFRVR